MRKIFIAFLGLSLLFCTACAKEERRVENPVGSVSISVSAADILDNMELFNAEKIDLLPEDGILLPKTELQFADGETAFDLVQVLMTENNIHCDIVDSGEFGKYIKAIGNIYEGDCGGASGWLYYVNGESPVTSADSYIPADGDVIEWVYVCDFVALWGL